MAQNPSNIMSSKPGSITPAMVKGKPNVVAGRGKVVNANQPIKPAIGTLPSAKAGARPQSSGNGVPSASAGVKLGTTKGNHNVNHAAGPASANLTHSIQQGK